MIVLIIIGVIIFLVVIGKKKPEPPKKNYYDAAKNQRVNITATSPKYDRNNIKITITGPVSKLASMDDSIIDVGSKSSLIESDYGLNSKVPDWSHTYIYSYSEINYATAQQKKFYQYFKDRFLNGEYLDLEGNTNYAFILLFDLQNEYENHKDIHKVEDQLNKLGEHYPKTKSYGISFLIQKMFALGDTEGIARLRGGNVYSYQVHNLDYDYWKLGTRYKTKLGLSDDEVKLLNKLWFTSNNFSCIENCCIEILKLYISVISGLKEIYVQEGITIENQFSLVADVVSRKHFKYRNGSQNYKYCIQTTPNEFYSHIFKHCENAVREFYGHKRKLNTDTYYTNEEVKAEYEGKIISKVTELIQGLTKEITLPDEATEIELYGQNTTRWKIKYEEIVHNYKEKPNEFIDSIIVLGELNKKNPSVENIFYEASKFIAKYDKESALTLYLHYLYHDLKSATFDNKQLTKTIQKSLFKSNEQIETFEAIVSTYINDKDFEKALSSVFQVYAVKRKKIQLDKTLIKEVQEQHSGTVELLNEYLQDENEEVANKEEIVSEEIEIKVAQNNEQPTISIYLNDFPFKPIHTSALEIFAKNNFSILQSEFEDFAKSKGVFKNQLIESINDICYENLDDVLIEEDEDYYTINENYYQKLLA